MPDILQHGGLARSYHILLSPDWMDHVPLPVVVCSYAASQHIDALYDHPALKDLLGVQQVVAPRLVQLYLMRPSHEVSAEDDTAFAEQVVRLVEERMRESLAKVYGRPDTDAIDVARVVLAVFSGGAWQCRRLVPSSE